MPVLAKVTILVEPLDGSPGYKVEIERAADIRTEHRYEDVESFNPTPFRFVEQRLVGVDVELDVLANPETGLTYRVTPL